MTRELFVDPVNAAVVYLAVASFGTDQVLRSLNAGAAWEALDGDLPDAPVNVVAADSRCNPSVLYAGTDAGLYRSINDGARWHRYGAGLPNACVIDILLDPGRNRLVIGTQGRGAWSIPIVSAGDFNGDGQRNVADFVAFQTAFALSDPRADYTGDGVLNVQDYIAFQTAFAVGCP